jgi:hypothetical protein
MSKKPQNGVGWVSVMIIFGVLQMKKCTKCLTETPLSGFNKSKKTKDGLNAWCRKCNNEYSREWAKKNKTRHTNNYQKWRANNLEYAKDLDRLRSYDLPIGRYNIILDIQKSCCAICKKDNNDSKKTFCVDHCHETGRVRGLLCHNCNTLLGHAKDNVAVLKNAINFLSNQVDYREDKWGRLGDQDDYFWQTPTEKANNA